MTAKQEPTREEVALDHFDWHILSELLEAGQYERATELLHQAQLISEAANEAFLADILAAAHRICLACSQCQAEVVWLRQGYEVAEQREHELGQQLQAILDLVSKRSAPEARERRPGALAPPTVTGDLPARDMPESGERSGLLQRVQSLFGRRSSPQSPEQETPVASAEALTPSWAEEPEAATPSTEKLKTPLAHATEKPKDRAPPLPQKVETATSPLAEVPAIVEEEEEQCPPALVIYCLGPFRVYQNDQLITEWNSLKSQAILKYLVMHKGGPIVKDILMDVFWPDVDFKDTRRNLHQAIYSLRQTLRRGVPDLQPIQFKEDCYLLNPEMGIWLDFAEFEKHVQAGRRLAAAGQLAEAMVEYSIAEGLYQGDFLEDDLYEDWPDLQREHLRSLYLDIADQLSEHYVQQGEYTAAIALCQKILSKDNCYEEAYRRLMQCYLAQGQRHLAVRQYQTCTQALQEELDLTPSEETMALYRRITTG